MSSKNKGKKKDQTDEPEKGDLFDNPDLLIYQNKSLCTLIENLEEKLRDTNEDCVKKEKIIEVLVKNFENFSLNIFNIIHSIQLKLPDKQKRDSVALDLSNESLKYIYTDITKFSYVDKVNDQIKSLIENLDSKVISLIFNLTKLIELENEVKDDLNASMNKVLSQKAQSEFEALKAENEELKSYSLTYFNQEKKILDEQHRLKAINLKLETSLNEKNLKIEELERKKFNLTRKLNTHPNLPYIHFKKKMLKYNAQEHECTCHICEKKFVQDDNVQEFRNTNPTSELAKEDNSLGKDSNIHDVKMQETATNNQKLINQDLIAELTSENEFLRSKMISLNENLENLKIENTITEEKIINSQAFKKILKDFDQYLQVFYNLQETYNDINSKYHLLQQEKENEQKNIESRYEGKLKEYENLLLQEKKKNEELKIEIEDYKAEISFKNDELILAKKDDIKSILETFNKEKSDYIIRIQNLNIRIKEIESKYTQECEKNKSLEMRIINSIVNIEKDGLLQEKLEQINNLENELRQEKEYNQANIEELEVNERGLMDLNKKIKNLTLQLKDAEDKIVKMTNEHTRSIDLFKRLNQEKEICKTQINQLEGKSEIEAELRSKQELQLRQLTNNLLLSEELVKLRDDEAAILKNLLERSNLEIERHNETELENKKVNEYLKNSLSKISVDLNVLTTKYENLCRMKNVNVDFEFKTYTQLQEELKGLNAALYMYKDMMKCNVCKEGNKDTIVTKCFHMTCKECMDNNFKNRNRTCPLCKTSISSSDLHPIFWD